MPKTQNPTLLLSDAERAALRKARIKVRDLGDMSPEDVVAATNGAMSLESARENCAHVAHYAVPGIGMSLAYDFWKAGFAHPRELVGISVEELAQKIGGAQGRALDLSYRRALQAAVAGVLRTFGTQPSGGAPPRVLAFEEPRPRLKPLPGGTRRAEVLKRPYPATVDQVRVTREGGTAILEYAEPGVFVVHFQVGPQLSSMSDEEVIDFHNSTLDAMEQLRHENDFPALEMPVGKPQVEWHERAYQWSARGHVLRCLISCGDDDHPSVIIDDKELTWEQFGRVVSSFEGWGMRIVFVDEDSLHETPRIEVREPGKDGR